MTFTIIIKVLESSIMWEMLDDSMSAYTAYSKFIMYFSEFNIYELLV